MSKKFFGNLYGADSDFKQKSPPLVLVCGLEGFIGTPKMEEMVAKSKKVCELFERAGMRTINAAELFFLSPYWSEQTYLDIMLSLVREADTMYLMSKDLDNPISQAIGYYSGVLKKPVMESVSLYSIGPRYELNEENIKEMKRELRYLEESGEDVDPEGKDAENLREVIKQYEDQHGVVENWEYEE